MTAEKLYEDAALIVCVKPVGASSETDMPQILREMGAKQALCVHRLDTAVGGVMVYAKTGACAAALSREIAEGRMEKRYLAVCVSCPEPPEGVMRDLLFKDLRANKSYVVKRARRGVRQAELSYRVLGSAKYGEESCSLVAVSLVTGRSHQIRVQFASRKMPLLGDVKYGSRVRECGIALWSTAIAFRHPISGERMEFSCPPPECFPWSLFEQEADA
jgi:23S rRNA pseudouridine1911/1915/1917 synthase